MDDATLPGRLRHEYLKNPLHCPWCGDDDIEFKGTVDLVEHNLTTAPQACNACDAEWTDTHVLQYTELTKPGRPTGLLAHAARLSSKVDVEARIISNPAVCPWCLSAYLKVVTSQLEYRPDGCGSTPSCEVQCMAACSNPACRAVFTLSYTVRELVRYMGGRPSALLASRHKERKVLCRAATT